MTLSRNKAIFLDRDGTINEEVSYLTKISDIKIFKGVISALHNLRKVGFLNIIITNQSAVARGMLNEDELNEIHKEFRKRLSSNDESLIDDIFYSPYHIDGSILKYKIQSDDRKPGLGLIKKAVREYNVNLEDSYFIGDTLTDMQCAENAKMKKILVLTGHGKSELIKCYNENIFIEYIAKNLLQASEYILNFHLEKNKKNVVY